MPVGPDESAALWRGDEAQAVLDPALAANQRRVAQPVADLVFGTPFGVHLPGGDGSKAGPVVRKDGGDAIVGILQPVDDPDAVVRDTFEGAGTGRVDNRQ